MAELESTVAAEDPVAAVAREIALAGYVPRGGLDAELLALFAPAQVLRNYAGVLATIGNSPRDGIGLPGVEYVK